MAEQPTDEAPAFPVHYIKAAHYHEISVDGAIGGITPKGDKIWMGLFAERFPIPRTVAYKPEPTGGDNEFRLNESAPPVYADTRNGLIRSVEVSAYFDIQTAVRLRDWLTTRIQQLEEKHNAVKNDGVRDSKP